MASAIGSLSEFSKTKRKRKIIIQVFMDNDYFITVPLFRNDKFKRLMDISSLYLGVDIKDLYFIYERQFIYANDKPKSFDMHGEVIIRCYQKNNLP